ncbi:MAG: hypothetical protein WDN00_10275 [Limisphaerales bacterium]
MDSGAIWSPTHQPTLEAKPGYEAIFSQARAEFRARVNEIDSHLEITVSPENDVEVRRITFTNHSDETRTIEVTTYAEIVLNTAAGGNCASRLQQSIHPDADRSPAERHHFVRADHAHRTKSCRASAILMLVHGNEIGKASLKPTVKNSSAVVATCHRPAAMQNSTPLSNSQGSVLDPVAAIRRTIRIEPKETATITLVSGIAPTRRRDYRTNRKYQDQTIADRCFELAWTHGSIVLRHLNTTEAEAQLFGRLAGALLYNQSARRANPGVLVRNQRRPAQPLELRHFR